MAIWTDDTDAHNLGTVSVHRCIMTPDQEPTIEQFTEAIYRVANVGFTVDSFAEAVHIVSEHISLIDRLKREGGNEILMPPLMRALYLLIEQRDAFEARERQGEGYFWSHYVAR